MSLFFLLIFINPFVPITLNILSFFVLFSQSWPVWFIGIFFSKCKNHLESSFTPLRFLLLNLLEELDFKLIFVAMRLTLEIKNIIFESDFLISNVSKTKSKKDFLFSLCPFNSWMESHVYVKMNKK